jgi:hypothetical protein
MYSQNTPLAASFAAAPEKVTDTGLPLVGVPVATIDALVPLPLEPAPDDDPAVMSQIFDDESHVVPVGHARPFPHCKPQTPATRHAVFGYLSAHGSSAPVPTEQFIVHMPASGAWPW